MAGRLHSVRVVYDVVIVGGGTAGLSAALVLGRSRRQVLVCDAGKPRNAAARALHGYLTRDGIAPLELIRLGRAELSQYGVELRAVTVSDVRPSPPDFDVMLETGQVVRGRSVLLATGVADHVPTIQGVADCYGVSVHHCPYCDGWESRDRALVALGERVSPVGLALALKTWSDRVTACTNGRVRVSATQRRTLAAEGIPLVTTRITRLEHDNGEVRQILFEDGRALPCDAVFFSAPQQQQCGLARTLGCEFTRGGTVKTNHLGQTCIQGIYVVGDASRDVQFAIVAAAEGAKAGVAINEALQARAGLTLAATEAMP